jgi:hypothetical protein
MTLFIAKQIYKHELRQLRQPRVSVKAIPFLDDELSNSHIQQYKTKFLFTSSSLELYSSLHKQCRSYQMTLNGPITACLLLAIHHCFPLDDNTRLKSFGISIPFDMRSRLPRSPLTSSSVGFFVGIGKFKIYRSRSILSTRFWSLAHECMTIIRNQLSVIGIPSIMNMLADIARDEHEFDEFSRLFPEGRQTEFGLSNIGKYPFSC